MRKEAQDRHFGVRRIPKKRTRSFEPYARSRDHTVGGFLLDEARTLAKEDSRHPDIKRADVVDWQRAAVRRRVETWENGKKVETVMDKIRALIDRVSYW